MIYLPPIVASKSSGERIAQMIALRKSSGRGSFSAKRHESPPAAASADGSFRIVGEDSVCVLDFFTYDYLQRLQKPPESVDAGVAAAIGQFLLRLKHFATSLLLLVAARARAKSTKARIQLMIGAIGGSASESCCW